MVQITIRPHMTEDEASTLAGMCASELKLDQPPTTGELSMWLANKVLDLARGGKHAFKQPHAHQGVASQAKTSKTGTGD